jgi:eukaryotic-like serine/threonine-protein kinase
MKLSRLLLRLAVAAPLAAAAAAATAALVVSLSSRGEEVTVPDLRGLDMAGAVEAASARKLAVALSGSAYDPSVPARHVISQTPDPGGTTRKNRILSVVMSRGSRSIAVPDLAGMDLRRAQLTLGQTGLAAGETAGVRRAGTAEGEVLAQNPPPGTLVSRGEPVALLVSAGPAPRLLVMGDLTALPVSEALRFLRGWKLVPGAIAPRPRGDLPPGTVTATSPPGGYPVAEGSVVEITVSSR